MQIINLSVSLHTLDEDSRRRIGNFISLFSKTYCQIKLEYFVEDLSLINQKELEALFQIEKNYCDFDTTNIYDVFDVQLDQLNKKWISFFNRNEISLRVHGSSDVNIDILKKIKAKKELVVHVDEKESITDLYQKLKEGTTPIEFVYKNDNFSSMIVHENGLEQYKQLFPIWLEDKKGILVKNFVQYVDAILGGSYRECFNDSCIGKRFYLSTNGDIYTCHKSCNSKHYYGNIDFIKSLNDIYDTDNMYKLLEDSLQRRQSCSDCKEFSHCQGGCFADSFKNENDVTKKHQIYCDNYKIFIEMVRYIINNHFEKCTNLNDLNSSFKDILINSLKMDIRL